MSVAGLPALAFPAPMKLRPTPRPNAPCSATKAMGLLPTRRLTESASLPVFRPFSSHPVAQPQQLEPAGVLPATRPLPLAALVCHTALSKHVYAHRILTSVTGSARASTGSTASSSDSAAAASASSTGNAASSIQIGASTAGLLGLLMAALAL